MRIHQLPGINPVSPEGKRYSGVKSLFVDLNHIAVIHDCYELDDQALRSLNSLRRSDYYGGHQVPWISFRIEMLLGGPTITYALYPDEDTKTGMMERPAGYVIDTIRMHRDDLIQAWKKAVGDIK